MADAVLERDPNHAAVSGGITDDVNKYTEPLRVDPTTKRLKVTATTTDLIGTQTRSVSAVSVTNTMGGIAIVAADATTKSIIIYNNGTATVFLGPSGVTAAAGLPLTAGSSFRESNINIALYGITAGATTEDIRVMLIKEA
jgi:hypothetical protein